MSQIRGHPHTEKRWNGQLLKTLEFTTPKSLIGRFLKSQNPLTWFNNDQISPISQIPPILARKWPSIGCIKMLLRGRGNLHKGLRLTQQTECCALNSTTTSETQGKHSQSMKPSGIGQMLLNAHVILKLDTRRNCCSHILPQVLIHPARSSRNVHPLKHNNGWKLICPIDASVHAYICSLISICFHPYNISIYVLYVYGVYIYIYICMWKHLNQNIYIYIPFFSLTLSLYLST